jgi:hypothetical protein
LGGEMQYQFDVEIAKKYGVEEAVIIQNFGFWIKKNQANNKNFHDGYYWTFNSAAALQELFPFWTASKVARLLRKLEEEGVLKSSNYNNNPYDRTKWYTIIDKSIIDTYQIDYSGLENRFSEGQQPIPDINTDINTDKKPDKEFSLASETKNKKNKSKTNNQDYKKVMDTYWRLYQKRTGQKPVINGETGRQIKNLLKSQEADQIAVVLEYFFNNEFWFTKKSGYSFRQFVFRYNEIQSAMTAHMKPYEIEARKNNDERRRMLEMIERQASAGAWG